MCGRTCLENPFANLSQALVQRERFLQAEEPFSTLVGQEFGGWASLRGFYCHSFSLREPLVAIVELICDQIWDIDDHYLPCNLSPFVRGR